jgi:hypothetical protein
MKNNSDNAPMPESCLASVSGSAFQSLEELKRNEHLISDLQTEEGGCQFRIVDGKKIYQIEEKTDEDRILNNAINLWRMRSR